jgi:hypothetical protein
MRWAFLPQRADQPTTQEHGLPILRTRIKTNRLQVGGAAKPNYSALQQFVLRYYRRIGMRHFL